MSHCRNLLENGVNKMSEISEAAKEARRKYSREYYRKNKEKRKQWNQSYWEKIAKTSNKKNRLSDIEKISKLVETYDLIEQCYKSIEEMVGKQMDIDTLTYSQINIAKLICDIIGTDDEENMFAELNLIENDPTEKAQHIIDFFKNE